MSIKQVQFYIPETQTLHTVLVQRYPDGTPMIKGFWTADGGVLDMCDTMVLRPQSMDTFVAAMFLVDAIADRGGKVRNLVIPHLPGGRQDRLNPEGDMLFTIKSVAKMINDRNFNRVVTLDPHSPVTPALIDRCKVYPLGSLFKTYWKGFNAVIAPDAGAGKRGQEVADMLGLPLIQAGKVRDVATGKLSGFSVAVEHGAHYLVVDDICDGGGTFLGLGEKIREQGAFANLFVTHGLFTKGTEDLLKVYKRITTTDSTLTDKPSVEKMAVIERMLQWTH